MTTPTPPSNTPVVPKTDREIADEASKRVVKLYNLSQALGDNYENHPIGDDEFQIEQLTPFFLEAITQAKAGLVEELTAQKTLALAEMRSYYSGLEAERDQLRAQLAEVTKERDTWAGRASRYVSDEQTHGTHSELAKKCENLSDALAMAENESNGLRAQIHDLCHDKHVAGPVTEQEFCNGCEAFQVKLFGSSIITKLKQSLSTSDAQNAEMRDAIKSVSQELDCPCRNTTVSSHRRDGSVIISNQTRDAIRSALSSSAGRDYVKREELKEELTTAASALAKATLEIVESMRTIRELQAELDKANALLRECQLHLGNSLDEVITTRRPQEGSALLGRGY